MLKPSKQREPGKDADSLDHNLRLRLRQMLLQLAASHQSLVFACGLSRFNSASVMRPVKTTVSMGNFSGRRCVLKKCTVKMNPVASSASSLWMMVATLMTATRQKAGEEDREPEHQSGRADDGDAPEHGEVVELLPVGPAAVVRPLGPMPLNHFMVAMNSSQVLPHGDHGVRRRRSASHAKTCTFSSSACQSDQMADEIGKHDDGGGAVNVAGKFGNRREAGKEQTAHPV